MRARDTRRSGCRFGRWLSRSGRCVVLPALVVNVACAPSTDPPPAVAFRDELRLLCGRAFPGRVTDITPLDSAVLGQPLVLSAWQCWSEELRFAFHVGDDHSRVWLIRFDRDGLGLRHENRLADGSAAEFTSYGGPATTDGTATRQTFTADDETVMRIPSAAGASWTLEILPRERLSYTFTPPDARSRFHIEFDLTVTAPRPPSPWGWTRAP
ncbi:MAG: hypothetical protein L0271_03700 [Gemmatimonadetes bacterium]|nr:hypothetical protein [Gemmatimonadota bacterium]